MKVLDKGFVELIQSVGNDTTISNAARIVKEEWRGLKDEKLIEYLLKHRHSSPFEHVVFTFHVKAPIFVFRQWHRHRSWSFNEISGRYSELKDEYYIPDINNIGVQSKGNHQSRVINKGFDKIQYGMIDIYKEGCEKAFEDYQFLLDQGNWPRELARCILPLATYSEMYATVNLWNLLHFISLRSDEHAQYEIQVYSNAMKEIIKEIVPVTIDKWNKLNETI